MNLNKVKDTREAKVVAKTVLGFIKDEAMKGGSDVSTLVDLVKKAGKDSLSVLTACDEILDVLDQDVKNGLIKRVSVLLGVPESSATNFLDLAREHKFVFASVLEALDKVISDEDRFIIIDQMIGEISDSVEKKGLSRDTDLGAMVFVQERLIAKGADYKEATKKAIKAISEVKRLSNSNKGVSDEELWKMLEKKL